MRTSLNKVSAFREGDNICLSFGFDFCAEHECGIKEIQYSFDCYDSNILAIERYKIKKVDNNIFLKKYSFKQNKNRKRKNVIVLLGGNSNDLKYIDENWLDRNIPYYDFVVSAMWDESSFCFCAETESPEAQIVLEIYKAILEKDAVIFMGGGGVFENPGIVISRYSTIPQELKDVFKTKYEDSQKLMEASDNIGIKQKIKKLYETRNSYPYSAFYALSPKWTFEDSKEKTKYPVMYWLNPTQQDMYNYGWYTVEELEKWYDYLAAEDKSGIDGGPIVMKKT